jgi:hypothetical protein
MKKTNDKYFPLNKKFYVQKWGGEPGKESRKNPVNGLKIDTRDNEVKIIESWMKK